MRGRFLIFFGITLASIFALLYILSNSIYLDSFVALEESEVIEDVTRVQELLGRELAELNTICGDYSGWDEAYRFVQDGNADFIRTNLDDAIFPQLRLNLLVFLDSAGQVRYGKAFDFRKQQEVPFPPALSHHLRPTDRLLSHPSPESQITGILRLPEGLLLVAARPVLKSDYSGPVMGTLVVGRYLDREKVMEIARTARQDISIIRVDTGESLPEISRMIDRLQAGDIHVETDGPTTVAGYALARDLYRAEAFVLKLDRHRAIYQQGLAAVRYFLMWSLGVSALAGLIVFFLLDRLSISRRRSRESDIRYRTVIERAAEGIVLVDPDSFRVIEANEAFAGFLGLELATVQTLHLPDVLALEREEGAEEIRRSLLAKREVCFRHRDGTLLTAELSSTAIPLRDRDALAVMVNDMSERKRGEMALQSAKEEAESANLAKSKFLANMSHELRTPVTVVMLSQEALLTTGLTDQQRELLEISDSSANRLLGIIDDLLDISKIEAHQLRIEVRSFDIRECVGRATAMFAMPAREKGILLQWTVAPEVPAVVKSDPDRLGQVLINLLGNAVKFTDRGEISFSVAREGGSLVFKVRDTGIGIPAGKLPLLFTPFTQVDNSLTRRHGGTGLGLAISRNLVELMGGSIQAESVEGQGSVFTFTIPLGVQ